MGEEDLGRVAAQTPEADKKTTAELLPAESEELKRRFRAGEKKLLAKNVENNKLELARDPDSQQAALKHTLTNEEGTVDYEILYDNGQWPLTVRKTVKPKEGPEERVEIQLSGTRLFGRTGTPTGGSYETYPGQFTDEELLSKFTEQILVDIRTAISERELLSSEELQEQIERVYTFGQQAEVSSSDAEEPEPRWGPARR